MSNEPHEHLIYIHGVSPENNQEHTESYNTLHKGISDITENFPNRDVWEQAGRCDVEWGWNRDNQPSPQGDRLLAEAQNKFSSEILPQIENARDLTVNPVRFLISPLRQLLLKGFSDMFYYVSRDGKSSVRATVASQVWNSVQQQIDDDRPISLTFLGHSAGSVIAFDFLFYLFAPQDVIKEHEFIETERSDIEDEEIESFKNIRALADSHKIRVRRLVTFGSPISMLAFRSNTLLEILSQGNGLNPSYYGLDLNHTEFGSPLKGARWLNFWDKDDIISWPIEPLMQPSTAVQDIYTDVGDFSSTVHNQYWKHKKVHEAIAANW